MSQLGTKSTTWIREQQKSAVQKKGKKRPKSAKEGWMRWVLLICPIFRHATARAVKKNKTTRSGRDRKWDFSGVAQEIPRAGTSTQQEPAYYPPPGRPRQSFCLGNQSRATNRAPQLPLLSGSRYGVPG